MRTAIKKAIEAHALKDYPREACGLIVAIKDKQKYIPCRNVAENNQDFRMPAEDYAAAEEQGQVLAVVHSHVNQDATPSEADMVSCEATALPWHIVSVKKDCDQETPHIAGWYSFEPSNYVAPLVGREFFHGVLDCYTLCRDFYKREMGIDIPDFERPDYWWNEKNCNELYLENFQKAGFVEVFDGPRFGDGILMQYRSNATNHAGIYLGEEQLKTQPGLPPVMNAMLHHAMPRLSERVVYAGYWRDVTRMIVRHKELM